MSLPQNTASLASGFSSLSGAGSDGLTVVYENLAAKSPETLPQNHAEYRDEYRGEYDCEKGMWMWSVNEVTGQALLFKARCKLWNCSHCAKINADLWTSRAVMGAQRMIEAGNELVLVTVTAHERHSVKRAVEKLPSQWNKLRNRWQRSCTKKPEYIMIPEVGKKGHFHLHLITDGLLGTRWWKDNARESGFGYSNDESDRFTNPHRAGYYVGKYLAKQLVQNLWKKGFHRVRHSQGWPQLPELAKDENWRFDVFEAGQSVEALAGSLSSQGYSVAVADHRSSWQYIATGQLNENVALLTL